MALFGCIADDFTGASDMASFLTKGGMSTQLFNGIPEPSFIPKAQGLVVSLKTRTQETASAVADSLAALDWLKKQGCVQFYVKYCSTFDSTAKGNIGPICDAVMDSLGATYTILCPALPVNGRTVRDGQLWVNGVLLENSSMRNHPLTPMRDSDLCRLMGAQSRYPCVRENAAPLSSTPYYVIPDCVTEEDLKAITDRYGHLVLLTGGSGPAPYLAQRLSAKNSPSLYPDGVKAPGLIICGSCSEATREQIQTYRESGGLCYHMNPLALAEGNQTAESIWQFIQENSGQDVLIYSSDTADNVAKARTHCQEDPSTLLENAAAQLAKLAVSSGYGRLIVAGGETSGAITQALGYSSYAIGGAIAPGVPVMTPMENHSLRLVLKSGNFGQKDFFIRALRQTEG